MTMTAEEVGTLVSRLDREQEIYGQLLALSRRQEEIIVADGEVDALLDVLGRKQVMIREIESIERELSPIKERWESEREQAPPARREEVEARVRGLRRTLEEVLELEDRGRSALEARQQELAGEIRKIGRSREAHAAYGARVTSPKPTGMIDNTG
jgi:hypothetical protein